jgi:hypothetical protein
MNKIKTQNIKMHTHATVPQWIVRRYQILAITKLACAVRVQSPFSGGAGTRCSDNRRTLSCT